MSKIICTIEARMGSKRLPGKTMLFLCKKFRLIDFVIINSLTSKYINKKNIFLLTSKKKENIKLIKYVKKKYNINIISGSENNVFSRYNFLKKKNKFVLRLTADNALVDPLLINQFIDFFITRKFDYLSTRSMVHSKKWNIKSDFPKGLSLEMFKSNKLLCKTKYFTKDNYEFPTYFFYNKIYKSNFKIAKFKSFSNYKKINLNKNYSIDTKSDYLKIKSLISKYCFKPGENNIFNYFNKLK